MGKDKHTSTYGIYPIGRKYKKFITLLNKYRSRYKSDLPVNTIVEIESIWNHGYINNSHIEFEGKYTPWEYMDVDFYSDKTMGIRIYKRKKGEFSEITYETEMPFKKPIRTNEQLIRKIIDVLIDYFSKN